MIAAVVVLAGAVAGGTVVTYLFDAHGGRLGWRLCAGAALGLPAHALLGLGAAFVFGITPASLWLSAACATAPVTLLFRPAFRSAVVRDLSAMDDAARSGVRRLTPAGAVGAGALAVAMWAGLRLLARVQFERADGMYTGFANNLGDLPFHLAVVSRFAYQGNLPPENPIFAGACFTYPFLSDFAAALLVRAGATLSSALFLQNSVLSVALLGIAYRWAVELTSDRATARLVPLLMLLNGGMGWWPAVLAAVRSPSTALRAVAHPDHDYTVVSNTVWRWGNMVTALLIPQRSFLWGLTLAICIFTLWNRSLRGEDALHPAGAPKGRQADTGSTSARGSEGRQMLAAGIMAGALPLVHSYTYAVVLMVAAVFVLLSGRLRPWMPFFAVSLGVGLPQIAWLMTCSSISSARFVGWHVGWDHGSANALWFWLLNTGPLIPLLAAAWIWRHPRGPVSRDIWRFYLPFTACFVVGNVFRLAPWIWDNIKVLIFWHIASAPLVATILVHLWRGHGLRRTAAIALAVSLTLAGTLDVWRVVSHASEFQLFTRDGMEFADRVRAAVPPESLVLHAPTYNHPVFLSGRRSLMGYVGHVWSHGLPPDAREADIRAVYAGAPEADHVIEKYGVGFIAFGPLERSQLQADPTVLARYRKVFAVGAYSLYEVPHQSGVRRLDSTTGFLQP